MMPDRRCRRCRRHHCHHLCWCLASAGESTRAQKPALRLAAMAKRAAQLQAELGAIRIPPTFEEALSLVSGSCVADHMRKVGTMIGWGAAFRPMVGGHRVSLKRAECRAMYNRKRNHLLAYSELLRGAIRHSEEAGSASPTLTPAATYACWYSACSGPQSPNRRARQHTDCAQVA